MRQRAKQYVLWILWSSALFLAAAWQSGSAILSFYDFIELLESVVDGLRVAIGSY